MISKMNQNPYPVGQPGKAVYLRISREEPGRRIIKNKTPIGQRKNARTNMEINQIFNN